MNILILKHFICHNNVVYLFRYKRLTIAMYASSFVRNSQFNDHFMRLKDGITDVIALSNSAQNMIIGMLPQKLLHRKKNIEEND